MLLEDKLCMWKEMSKDEKSSTFEDARKDPMHTLHACYPCKGYNTNCKYYVNLNEPYFKDNDYK